jgi:hypothetical protein
MPIRDDDDDDDDAAAAADQQRNDDEDAVVVAAAAIPLGNNSPTAAKTTTSAAAAAAATATTTTTLPLISQAPTTSMVHNTNNNNNNNLRTTTTTNHNDNTPRRRRFWQTITTTRRRRRRSTLEEDEDEDEQQRKAEELVKRLQYGGDVLLERLFSFLSQLPEENEGELESTNGTTINNENNNPQQQQHEQQQQNQLHQQQGMTLPAAAVAWLSSQLYPNDGRSAIKQQQQRRQKKQSLPGNGEEKDEQYQQEQQEEEENKNEMEECCSIVSSFLPMEEEEEEENYDGIDNDENTVGGGGRGGGGGDFHGHQRFWMGGAAQRDRISLLRFFLPRLKLLRISRQPWPPQLPKGVQQQQQRQQNSSSFSSRRSRGVSPPLPTQQSRQQQHQSTPIRQRRPPSDELNCSTVSSVSSAITMEAALLSLSPSNNVRNIDDATTIMTPRQAFFLYMDKLEHSPRVDLRVFSRTKVLVLEGIPPTWIVNLPVLQPTLQVLTIHRAAIYHLPSLFFSSADNNQKKKQQQPKGGQQAEGGTTSLLLPSRFYPHLTHLKLERCSVGERSGLVSTLSKLDNVQYLSLQYNEISSEHTALRGLKYLSHLTQVDYRHNRIGPSLPNAFLYFGGQLSVLKLSYNQIKSLRGLDRCYALHELWLDGNHFPTVQDVSTLARLPQLNYIQLQQNPFTTLGNSNFDPDWKVQLWTWFQEHRRAIVPGELPILVDDTNNYMKKNATITTTNNATIGRVGNAYPRGPKYGPVMKATEWAQILEGSFSNVTTTASTIAMATIVGTPLGSGGGGIPPLLEQRISTPTSISTIVTDNRNCALLAYDETTDKLKMVPTTPSLPGFSSTTTALEESGTTTQMMMESQSRGTSTNPSQLLLLLSPMRNRRVIKKGTTRKVMIQDDSNSTLPDANTTLERRKRRNQLKNGMIKKSVLSTGSDTIQITQQSPNGSPMKDSMAAMMSLQNKNSKDDEGQPPRSLSFSLQDVLELLQEKSTVSGPRNADKKGDNGNTHKEDSFPDDECISSSIPSIDQLHLSSVVMEDESTSQKTKPADRRTCSKNPFDDDDDNNFDDDPAVLSMGLSSTSSVSEEGIAALDICGKDIQGLVNDVDDPPPENVQIDNSKSVPVMKTTDPNSTSPSNPRLTDEQAVENATSEEKTNHSIVEGSQNISQKLIVPPSTSSPERIFPKPKVATIKLNTGANARPYDVLNYDWDELIKRASEGLIPDGIPKVPIAILEQEIAKDVIRGNEVFPTQTTNLLADVTTESGVLSFAGRNNNNINNNQSVVASISASDPILDTDLSSIRLGTMSLPDHVWQDDSSVLSSLGGSRDDYPANGYNKFHLAEENSIYDGPEFCREMKVVENLKLYFESYVFPTSMPDVPQSIVDELQVDDDDWQTLALYYPRIQLWPDDRRSLENVLETDTIQIADWSSNRERFVRLWEEDLIPCGKAALRRLPPNRRIRLGFHGEKLFEGANLDAYTECRKVVLCLSTKALYVIVGEDDVTASHQLQAKKRRFPLPLDKDLSFRDAPWPHAVARHSLLDLEAVCIGFEFQRLILRFRNPLLRKSGPFVYTLLTSNKKASVSILQEIQGLFKELCECSLTTNRRSKTSVTLPIENDSNHMFDALNLAVSPDPIGTIIHYQIVQQQWKRGDRGTVRRICIVSDTKILLLDEDYMADGHRLNNITVDGDHMADVSCRIVDEGLLKQISEVEAAGSDPKAITISISPLSSLSRTHRWRLVCRDREGAERLIDDVRKALDMYQKGGTSFGRTNY